MNSTFSFVFHKKQNPAVTQCTASFKATKAWICKEMNVTITYKYGTKNKRINFWGNICIYHKIYK